MSSGQFYDYDGEDELVGLVRPEPGDRIQLVREPRNREDANAVRVEWRNRFMLGHLPRAVAGAVAPRLDASEGLRGYVLRPGNGSAWSMTLLIIGDAATDLVADVARLERTTAEMVEDAVAMVWRPAPEPTERQRASAATWENRAFAAQVARHAALTYAFSQLPVAVPDVDLDADPGPQGTTYRRWDELPSGLRTKTQWRELRRRPRRSATPWAAIEYGRGYRWRRYDLFAVGDVELLPAASPRARGAAAERTFWAAMV